MQSQIFFWVLSEIMVSDWAELSKSFLDPILEKLVSLSDYLRFSVVCKSWYRVAKNNQCQRAKISGCHHPPMLMISTGRKRTWNLYNVIENKIFSLELRVRVKRFCGLSKVWLIAIDEDFVVTLINPFLRIQGGKNKEHSRVKSGKNKENSIIRLPPINPPRLQENPFRRSQWAAQCDHYIFKATITADPILDAKNCTVVVIYEDLCQLAFIRLGKDKTWTYFDTSTEESKRWGSIYEVVNVEDKFYVVDGPGSTSRLSSFDITNESHSDKKLVAQEIDRRGRGYIFKRYLVDLNEKELLLVHRDLISDPEYGTPVTKGFKVFGLNLDKCEWIEKETLGDVALFVGDNSSVSVLASNFPKCQPNCIYFNHDSLRRTTYFEPPRDFGVYNMENQTISQPYTTEAMKLVKKTNQLPIWIVPTVKL